MPTAEEFPLNLPQKMLTPEQRIAAYREAAARRRPADQPAEGGRDNRSHPAAEAASAVSGASAEAPAADEHVAHHFDSAAQQTKAARLGMWVFLATEVMMFGGLFCLYGTFRYLWPDAFVYGHRFLDVGWGAINTVIMVLSSFTMALAVYCAQRNHREALMLFLTLTIICGVCFLGVKAIEYRHKIEAGLLWGERFEPPSPAVVAPAIPAIDIPGGPGAQAAPAVDLAAGRRLYMATCMGCHGADGEGISGVAPPLRGSAFVSAATLEQVSALIRNGRQPDDPQSVMNALMPARGGNPFLGEDDITNIAGYVRNLNGDHGGEGAEAAAPAVASADSPEEQIALLVPRWSATRPPQADSGLTPAWRTGDLSFFQPPKTPDSVPAHASTYFSLYFLMTGLHGVHLLIGMGIVTWLLLRASRWHFSPAYSTPVEIGGLYWHLVDLVWLVLFPLFYLVG